MATYEITDLTVNVDFECHEEGKLDRPKVNYRAKVEFESLAHLLAYGGESVTRTLQTWARKGKFSADERVTVKAGEKVEFVKPVSKEDIERMTDEQLDAAYAELMARKAAKAAAEKAAKTK
jgi:hypothetical protein